eukprot:gene3333-4178_t
MAQQCSQVEQEGNLFSGFFEVNPFNNTSEYVKISLPQLLFSTEAKYPNISSFCSLDSITNNIGSIDFKSSESTYNFSLVVVNQDAMKSLMINEMMFSNGPNDNCPCASQAPSPGSFVVGITFNIYATKVDFKNNYHLKPCSLKIQYSNSPLKNGDTFSQIVNVTVVDEKGNLILYGVLSGIGLVVLVTIIGFIAYYIIKKRRYRDKYKMNFSTTPNPNTAINNDFIDNRPLLLYDSVGSFNHFYQPSNLIDPAFEDDEDENGEVDESNDIKDWILSTPDFITKVFGLLEFTITQDVTIHLLNEIFFSIPRPFDLRTIKNFHQVINKLSDPQLYSLLKILTECTFEDGDNSIERTIEFRNSLAIQYSINKSIILGVSNILERVVSMLEYTLHNDWVSPMFSDMITDNSDDNFNDFINEAITEDTISNLFTQFNLPTTTTTNNTTIQNPLIRIQEFTTAAYQSDILIFLYCIASGNRTLPTLTKLSELGLPKIIEQIFISLDWSKSERNDDFNPYFIKKNQVIRILLLFFEVDTINEGKKDFMLSPHDLHILRNGGETDCKEDCKWSDRPNILTRLYHSFLQSYPDTTHEKSILSYAIETAMRTYGTQLRLYYTRCGLLKKLLTDCIRNPSFIQTSFDLLAELIKENRYIFQQMNQIFDQDPSLFREFSEILVGNLIQTNVCLRVLILSLHKFKDEDIKNNHNEKQRYPFESCKINQLIQENQDNIFKLLVLCFKDNEINLDNICCLNTGILYLMVKKKEGSLPDNYVNKIMEIDREEKEKANLEENSIGFIRLLKQLLETWKSFYTFNSKDVKNLEMSSGFKFLEIYDLAIQLLNI